MEKGSGDKGEDMVRQRGKRVSGGVNDLRQARRWEEEMPPSDLVRASTGRLRGSPGLCHSGQFSSAGRPEALPAS